MSILHGEKISLGNCLLIVAAEWLVDAAWMEEKSSPMS
jgi:hypothetical protein